MPPRTISPPSSLPTITLEPLTPISFSPFGHVIQNPHTSGATVNYGTANKHFRISPFISQYPPSSRSATSNINLFVCAPRVLTSTGHYLCHVLERHPYTTQTFIPLNAPGTARYIVIVAPTREDDGIPDLARIRAFCAGAGQAVTYGVGTWHAPMFVVGEKEIEFVVLVNENGVAEEDTEEVFLEGGVKMRVVMAGGLWAKL